MSKRYRRLVFMAIAGLIIAACTPQAAEPSPSAPPTQETPAASAGGQTAWDDLVAEAKGQTVNFYHWGGASNINEFVAGYIGKRLKDEYDITLNPVLINDTVDAVNTVLGEKEAGRNEDGAVDLIWINGENFRTLAQADLLYGPYVDQLPNMQYVDPDDDRINFDAGVPIEGRQSLWESGQFVMEYDTAQVTDYPRTIPDLVDWVCENPGKFTYAAPPDFTGSLFLMHFFYHYAGGAEKWQGEFTEAKKAEFDAAVPAVWDALNKMRPCLWREGSTYPADSTQMGQLLANGEIAMNMDYSPGHASAQILNGTYPDAIRTYVFDEGTVAPQAYVAIPYNSPHKAAAVVAANLLLDPAAQLEMMKPDGWGTSTVLSLGLLPQESQDAFKSLELGPATLPLSVLDEATKLPIMRADMIPLLEEGWRKNVLQQ